MNYNIVLAHRATKIELQNLDEHHRILQPLNDD